MLLTLMLWLNGHRTEVVIVAAVMLWTLPYYWYFRRMLRHWYRRGRRHDWSIDMATKKAVHSGKEELR